jgi:hypothetical protein
MHVRRGTAPNLYEVESETEPDTWHQVFAKDTEIKCTCKAYQTSKRPKTCKHFGAVQEYLQQPEGGIEPEEEEGMTVPPPTPGLSRWVKKIHGRDFVQYEGLLAMAHEQGLTELAAEFISVTSELALAAAHAFFADGRKFWEAADATPANVNVNVKAHYSQCALTRAKARVLRDALNIGMVSVEELNEDYILDR